MTNAKTKPPARDIYRLISRAWGPQEWWPAKTRFEMMVGAILTQNTAWINVEKAIRNLVMARVLNPSAIYTIRQQELAELIHPSGYYNIKAHRLKNLAANIVEHHGGSISRMLKGTPHEVRSRLLAINGIGKETADSILLYAGKMPFFVVDAYTRRFLERHGWVQPKASYEDIAELLSEPFNNLPAPKRTKLFNEFHALIVLLAKKNCRKKPDCNSCPLNRYEVV
ncbi:MAG TPA: endonuclease III domain-containing protein [Kiritimatiellia bacterium]|nr:endonuclease III domain-containing protein [Kiritimatiellia bacterium]